MCSPPRIVRSVITIPTNRVFTQCLVHCGLKSRSDAGNTTSASTRTAAHSPLPPLHSIVRSTTPSPHIMGILDTVRNNSHSGGIAGALLRALLRSVQFVLAIVVAALYGIDLHHAQKENAYTDGKWVYAEVVAGLSAVTCLVYAVPFIKSYWAFGWDWILL
nr:hypothetical protein CFP56_31839 [Quercus suber]